MSQRIRPVSEDVVHRISSGQVVVNLATAVKELIENALDAGAKNIEVKLKEYGTELIEVADDGTGVSKADLASLTLKHHTSKFTSIDDLQALDSFGFRGEALSSLCAVSELMVTTRTAQDVTGSRVSYDASGKIAQQTPVARARGTTIALRELFRPLPVRRKELLRNVKREFGKLLNLLQAYAIISYGVRIICTNQIGTGTRTKALSTQGGQRMRDNIANAFGPRTAEALMPLDASLGDIAKACGYISKENAFFGKSGGDRQYFYINGRPVHLPKARASPEHGAAAQFSKALNDAHRNLAKGTASGASRPMAFIDFKIPKANYDINLAPDKRKALIQQEQCLLELFQEALSEAWQPVNTLLDQPLSQAVLQGARQVPGSHKQVGRQSSSPSSSSLQSASEASSGSDMPAAREMPAELIPRNPPELSRPRGMEKQSYPVERDGENAVPDRDANEDEPLMASQPHQASAGPAFLTSKGVLAASSAAGEEGGLASGGHTLSLCAEAPPSAAQSLHSPATKPQDEITPSVQPQQALSGLVMEPENGLPTSGALQSMAHSVPRKRSRQETGVAKDAQPSSWHPQPQQAPMTMHIDLEALAASRTACSKPTETGTTAHFSAATLQDPAQAASEAADREIQRVFQKKDFAIMEIVGQFNLGFILARLAGNLFIIDQHAADEKYNFERLQQITRLNKQPLLQPLRLDVTPAEKMTLWQEQQVFNANGFDFKELEDGQVQLTAVPFSKEAVFGPQDVHELLHMLVHGEGQAFKMQTQQSTQHSQPSDSTQAAPRPFTKIVRPSRVRDMLAMRACRSSIMIGKALNRTQMKSVLVHLSHLDSPWNCPHGRPTMRHLHTLQQQ
ncbi:hypothetical protein CVIRNUC_004069 [Coccomyxa viridis]|uniref:Uncharacterized protein n=1 Tax=Coccomyxa viridis TaxID=1274662 RepID=A0AAV1I1F9_9CHLO|nr:hypothetical protein CVIRNUC_004069 [Coccomyxa viridis]